MIKKIHILLLLLIIPFISFNKVNAQEIGRDKLLHFYYGNFSAGVGSIIYINSTKKPTLKGKILVSFGSAMLIGTSKEIYDINRTGFDIKDLVATVMGAVPITIVFSLEEHLNKNKRRRRKINRRLKRNSMFILNKEYHDIHDI